MARISRQMESREGTARPSMRRDNTRYSLDLSKKPRDAAYLWGRCSIAGKPDDDNMAMLQEQGYRPVPAERHPEKQLPGSEGNATIVRGGLMLMERPQDYEDDYREDLLDENRAKEAAANRNVFHDPNFPGTREVSTVVERKARGQRPTTTRFEED